MATTPSAPPTLAERAAELHWYHTVDLAPGVATEGWFDTRATVDRVPLPRDLRGKRCLDVGTWDGFWAFEMERRGAASITAIDVEDPQGWDWPPNSEFDAAREGRLAFLGGFKSGAASFALAKEALASKVERVDCSVYDLDPEVHGTFDQVFLGTLLLHLRDPVRALAAIRRVCSGELVVAESVELAASILRPRTPTMRLEGLDEPWWWQPNVAGLRRMVASAGFAIVETTPLYFLPLGPAHPLPPLRTQWRSLATPAGREKAVTRFRGIPHSALRARPLG